MCDATLQTSISKMNKSNSSEQQDSALTRQHANKRRDTSEEGETKRKLF
jgi:hypothetical protein